MHPSGRPIQLLKITATGARSLEKIRDKPNFSFSTALRLKRDYYFTNADAIGESPLDHMSSFMHDRGLKPMFDVLIRAGRYHEVPEEQRVSHSQVEYTAQYKDLVSLGQQTDTAWKIFSFSIKTTEGRVPSYINNAVIQIAAMVARKGESKPYLRAIFTLGTCSAIVGAEVHQYTDEASLLLGWKEFLMKSDPDVVTGYDIAKFGIPYLIFRANHLGLAGFSALGRLDGEQTVPASFDRSWKDTPTLTGRLVFDVGKHIWDTVKDKVRRSAADSSDFRRDALVTKYLEEFKGDDVDNKCQNTLQEGGPDDRRRLAVSCLKFKDAYFSHRLLTCPTLRFLEEAVQAARANNVPFNFYTTNGPELPKRRRFT
ncbi:ribonuclease H-like domain-containing protein [Mycena latifolia]|nr:ribonuclease H-like domain-containing protein [Mycena latifolia]